MTPAPNGITMGQRIELAMRRRRVTQVELRDMTGISVRRIALMQRNIERPTSSELIVIAGVLKVDVEEITGPAVDVQPSLEKSPVQVETARPVGECPACTIFAQFDDTITSCNCSFPSPQSGDNCSAPVSGVSEESRPTSQQTSEPALPAYSEQPPSARVVEKGERLVRNGAVTVVGDGAFLVRGDSAVYNVSHDSGGWSCDCPATRTCAHILAARQMEVRR